jgi:hypothetical protein
VALGVHGGAGVLSAAIMTGLVSAILHQTCYFMGLALEAEWQ